MHTSSVQKVFFILSLTCVWMFALGRSNPIRKAVNPRYDPGICNNKTRGNLVVVKDPNGEDKLVVCVKKGLKFRWTMLNGYSRGNYFDPAKDCSDVVDNVPAAKNGVYWIKTEQGPKKAWCDVMTDGGGFMLIGVQNSSVSWDVPSNPSLVHPSQPRHWSSAFGGKDVLDFRVQISTSDRLTDTKAHWFYRFNTMRKLTKLLIFNKGNCGTHPGVGDIQYVKDLLRGKVVTRSFQCSNFGTHFNKHFGWGKMNTCFGTPCKQGFAYFHTIKLDTHGSFSFSATSPKSGLYQTSTAFIGCDHGKCCACFGPSSDRDFCAPKCKAINGGTVLTKNNKVHAWFWIRSSLPKRVWKKCMEYKRKTKKGDTETWHVDVDGVPRKGSCSRPGDVRLHDGIAVVSNSRSMNRLPNLQGLLSYRSDNENLYLRRKSQWAEIGYQREIKDNQNTINTLLGEIKQLKKDVENLEHESCRRILHLNSNARNGPYKIRNNNGGFNNAYCQMTSLPGCIGGGWTMVMKVDGRKGTFSYSSSYWSNKRSYNLAGGLTGFDEQETKLPTYWSTSFKELCIGMKVGSDLRFVSIDYPAGSLYSVIGGGRYRRTHLGRNRWKSLIYGSSLQRNCNMEGFNVMKTSYLAVRIGILGNQENECHSPDSFVGLGSHVNHVPYRCGYPINPNTAGNMASCSPDNGNKNIKAMAYILVR